LTVVSHGGLKKGKHCRSPRLTSLVLVAGKNGFLLFTEVT